MTTLNSKDKDIDYIINTKITENAVLSTNVAGTTFIENINDILSDFRDLLRDSHKLQVWLRRDRKNPHDENAVEVFIACKEKNIKPIKIGYIPRKNNEVIAYVLDNKDKYEIGTYGIEIIGHDEFRENFGVFFKYKFRKTVR